MTWIACCVAGVCAHGCQHFCVCLHRQVSRKGVYSQSRQRPSYCNPVSPDTGIVARTHCRCCCRERSASTPPVSQCCSLSLCTPVLFMLLLDGRKHKIRCLSVCNCVYICVHIWHWYVCSGALEPLGGKNHKSNASSV